MSPLSLNNTALPLVELLPAAWREARRRFLVMVALFVLIALVALGVAYSWPKQFHSSTSILVSEDNIIRQLLEGRAVATSVHDRALIAREVIFSRKVMDEVMAGGGWLDDAPAPAERERRARMIEQRTTIGTPRENLIRIAYWDPEPRRARLVAEHFATSFIEESTEAKRRESREAYEFVADQVKQYQAILMEAELRLKRFRDSSEDARPGSGEEVSLRVAELRRDIDNWNLERMDLQSRQVSLETQLNGVSSETGVQTYQAQLRQRITVVQEELDTLLLGLTPQHPDVVRVRLQIEDLRAELAASGERGPMPASAGGLEQNLLHQELVSALAATRREIAGLNARIRATERLLSQEIQRRRRVGDTDLQLAELSRDHAVNQTIYEDLLSRLENARLSMRLDEVGRGLTFSIHEPAIEPAQASGLRFAHLAMGGMMAALGTPLGLLLLLVRLDPRLRSPQAVERATQIPVLAAVPRHLSHADHRREARQVRMALLLVGLTLVAYAVAAILRLGLIQ
jgi:polysaccharide chain length determinant protein (PEP-CTERM system associated)